jgi:hypothetical protein
VYFGADLRFLGEFLRDRARQATEGALALVRQQVLFGGFYKIYLDQAMSGLDGKYPLRDGGQYAIAGWWRQPRPFPMDDTCVGWLDVAAGSDRWRIILPALFSAMEAILVPESSSALKAGVVTVRSLAVQVALEKEFLSPGEIMRGYQLRSDLAAVRCSVRQRKAAPGQRTAAADHASRQARMQPPMSSATAA